MSGSDRSGLPDNTLLWFLTSTRKEVLNQALFVPPFGDSCLKLVQSEGNSF